MMIYVRGAGVAGIVTALTLREAGFPVTLCEKNPALAQEASGFAGAMIAPFCEAGAGIAAVAQWGKDSLAWWKTHAPQHVHCTGSVVFAGTHSLEELVHFQRKAGTGEIWRRQRLEQEEPDISPQFAHGVYVAEEGHLDPRTTLEFLGEKFLRLGGRLELSQETVPEKDSWVVDCRGIHSREALPTLRGVVGERLYVHAPDVHLGRAVRWLHPRAPVYIVPHGNGRFMIGATMIETDDAPFLSVRGALDLLHRAVQLIPALDQGKILSLEAGVRPAFPTNLPQIHREGKTFYLNGMYRHGFLLAPACARQLTKEMKEALSSPQRCGKDLKKNSLLG